jgi:hypothetical protein
LGAPVVALAIAACGEAFTSATDDSGPGAADVLVDVGAVDVLTSDASLTSDAHSHDVLSEQVTLTDGTPGPAEAGSGDGAGCARVCPSGFDCILGKCDDRVVPHFSTTASGSGNWQYGYESSMASTFIRYMSQWRANGALDFWSVLSGSIEPSVFHNSTLGTVNYDAMAVPPDGLALYPGSTGQVSVVRWIAPENGSYSVQATFTGISYKGAVPDAAVGVGVLFANVVSMGASSTLNSYGGTNSFTYAPGSQALSANTAVDFYVTFLTNADDLQGGTQLNAHIVAN